MLKNIILYIVLNTILVACQSKTGKFEESRLEKIILCETLEDPTEIAVSNYGDVFIIERNGKIKI